MLYVDNEKVESTLKMYIVVIKTHFKCKDLRLLKRVVSPLTFL